MTATIAAGCTLVGSQAASATTLHDGLNYSGDSYGADNSTWVGSLNDRATSIKNYGYTISWFNDVNYGGDGLRTYNDYNDLRSVQDWQGYNWNDRISSYKRS
ncbi:hypothetical protein IG195_08655 [Arthrobacter sp. TES]|uniref:1,4-beta-N-acetylmuramidase n=1 Tax=Paenarthrobacter ureafaciens TaxID=37931 RepID=A0AAX3EHP1_PAEUR|nr:MULTISPECIES: hypothetical protein [Paenarthrobacter]ERI35529.1 hypothetical protein M707_21195 [Arthrobacter sp. AK-YN10]NKR13648.1 hypothetical protein [Arthrobacter sp. M5]NKR17673.1 hypothetical protein [Arthrobacter sp. M6]OEH58145.1 hypothetical protein A5N13_21710 [Arthrobacter sp. D4]OEH58247.1 hypothetical protein A5N17_21780 [Arthrobacter sp. D2]QOI65084.1 hypothetical protein IG195_08655 [Arthrobacter sp. TES]